VLCGYDDEAEVEIDFNRALPYETITKLREIIGGRPTDIIFDRGTFNYIQFNFINGRDVQRRPWALHWMAKLISGLQASLDTMLMPIQVGGTRPIVELTDLDQNTNTFSVRGSNLSVFVRNGKIHLDPLIRQNEFRNFTLRLSSSFSAEKNTSELQQMIDQFNNTYGLFLEQKVITILGQKLPELLPTGFTLKIEKANYERYVAVQYGLNDIYVKDDGFVCVIQSPFHSSSWESFMHR
jgi:hypothetical protein